MSSIASAPPPGPFDESALLAEARRTCGLSDFGDEDFRVPLRTLLASLSGEAGLNRDGAAAFHGRIVQSLVTRLRAQDWRARHPEIARETIERPLVIVGMTRTGTTLLQRAIARDRRLYSALDWELREPAPRPGTRFDRPDPRIPDAEERSRLAHETSPELMAIHPGKAHDPEEEILLFEDAFLSHVPEASCYVPSYRAWLDGQDFTPAYDHLKRMLQLLQWQKQRRGERRDRWLLKTPAHLGYLETLFAAFPDAHVVHAHRHPFESVPSGASLNFSIWRMNSDHADPKRVGRQWKQRMAWAVRRALAARDRLPRAESRFTDVWYRDAVADPLAQVERVYAAAGLELDAPTRAEMRDWLLRNHTRSRPPVHRYTLEQFGLTREEIREAFADYLARFFPTS